MWIVSENSGQMNALPMLLIQHPFLPSIYPLIHLLTYPLINLFILFIKSTLPTHPSKIGGGEYVCFIKINA